ncbi:hypothetical protein CRG98_016721 [Punica granatum]|uniref:Uncharacterized protein n=1 Tax=Punica granatum TaxID=22663 RepID=A0A2I0K2V5_PUNGR|nr:hypothetical protein CRG98_016721 [Punica granatum]
MGDSESITITARTQHANHKTFPAEYEKLRRRREPDTRDRRRSRSLSPLFISRSSCRGQRDHGLFQDPNLAPKTPAPLDLVIICGAEIDLRHRAAAPLLLTPVSALAAEIKKAALSDINLTLPIIMGEFLLLVLVLDKI